MSNTKNQSTDILIIGAGPSGTVAAAILNKKGYKVKVVEKQKFPRFVIGESLLPRCMENLEKADLIDVIEKTGFQKKFGAKFVHVREVCNFDFSIQFTKGWSWTWQVQRANFDHLIAEEIAKRGVEVEYESAVTDIKFSEDGTSTATITRNDNTSYSIDAKFVVDGSGFGRVLPRLLELEKPSEFPARTALFAHLKPQQIQTGKERNQIIIIVHTNEVWGWVIPFADGTSSIGIVGDIEHVNQFEGSDEEKVRQWIKTIPALTDRFTGSEIVFGPKAITGYSSAVKKHHGKNFVLTGNSSEFVDPIFSSGVTFATESAALAAELIDRQLSGESVDWDEEFTAYIQRGVDVFKSFIKHWYDGALPKIFFSETPDNSDIKKQICSILAGYVWDQKNPFVRKHKRAISALAAVVD